MRYGSVLAKERILLSGDDVKIARVLGKILKRRGYVFQIVKNPDNILPCIKEFSPDIVILDYTGEKNLNFSIIKLLKKFKYMTYIPVIVLGREFNNYKNVTRYLEAGAEDCILKPLNKEYFLAKLKVILARKIARGQPEEILKHKEIMLNLTNHTVYVRNKPVKVTPKEFALLYFLMKRGGGVLSRRTLISSIWEHKYFGNMKTVNVHVQSLRKKLGFAGKYIEAVEGVGYRLKK